MTRTIRKLDKVDFSLRTKKIDPYFARHGVSRPRGPAENRRPFLGALFGFGWIYFVISIAENKHTFRDSLAAGGLDAQWHGWILNGLGLLLILSVVAILAHLARFLLRRPGHRGASGSILIGALGAMLLAYTPTHVMQTDLPGLGRSTQDLLAAARTDDGDINLRSVSLVFAREATAEGATRLD